MKTLKQYAEEIGAKIGSTDLSDCQVVKITNKGSGFIGMNAIVGWVEVAVSGKGLNNTGVWPVAALKDQAGLLSLKAS